MAEVSIPCSPGQTLRDSGVNDGDQVGGEVVEKSLVFLRFRPPSFRVGQSFAGDLLFCRTSDCLA